MKILEAKGVTKSFAKLPVLKGVDLTLSKGDIYVIFGSNGVGKTTLIKILATLTKPDSGTLRMFGSDVAEDRTYVRSKLGFVSPERYLYNDLTARENLEFFAELYSVKDRDRKIKQLLKDVDLFHRSHDLVGTFSKGMAQRLSIARAVIHDPELVLMDEPYSGLDLRARETLNGMIFELNKKGTSFFIITHDINEGFDIATKCGLLSGGRITEECRASKKAEFAKKFGTVIRGETC